MQERFDGEARGYTIGQLAKLAGVSARTLRPLRGRRPPPSLEDGFELPRLPRAGRAAARAYRRHEGVRIAAPDHPPPARGSGADVIASLSSHLRYLLQQEKSLEEAIARTERAIAAIEG